MIVLPVCLEVAGGRRFSQPRAHFRRAERYDRFAGGDKRPGEVTDVSTTVLYSRSAMARWRTEEDPTRLTRGLVSLWLFELRGLSPVPSNRDHLSGGVLSVVLGVCSESVGNLSDPS